MASRAGLPLADSPPVGAMPKPIWIGSAAWATNAPAPPAPPSRPPPRSPPSGASAVSPAASCASSLSAPRASHAPPVRRAKDCARALDLVKAGDHPRAARAAAQAGLQLPATSAPCSVIDVRCAPGMVWTSTRPATSDHQRSRRGGLPPLGHEQRDRSRVAARDVVTARPGEKWPPARSPATRGALWGEVEIVARVRAGDRPRRARGLPAEWAGGGRRGARRRQLGRRPASSVARSTRRRNSAPSAPRSSLPTQASARARRLTRRKRALRAGRR